MTEKTNIKSSDGVVKEKSSDKAPRKKENEDTKDKESQLYEFGYHLLPTIASEAIAEEVTKLKNIIETHGGIMISDEMPKMVQLAYPISKVFANKRKFFESAYFGWIRYQMPALKNPELKEELEKNENILRFILIKTVLEKAIVPKRMSFFSSQKLMAVKRAREKDLVEEEKRGKEMTEAELDKTIEELIVE